MERAVVLLLKQKKKKPFDIGTPNRQHEIRLILRKFNKLIATEPGSSVQRKEHPLKNVA